MPTLETAIKKYIRLGYTNKAIVQQLRQDDPSITAKKLTATISEMFYNSPFYDKVELLPNYLTPREFEVSLLAAQGNNNEAIAAVLGVSRKTVEVNLFWVYKKLQIPNRTSLLNYFKPFVSTTSLGFRQASS